jgi:glutamyl-tRNA synthetase
LIKERAHFVSEFWEMSDFFVAPTNMMKKPVKTGKRNSTLMQELISVVEEITDFTL